MSFNLPQQALSGGRGPSQGPFTLSESDPTLPSHATGRVSDNGAVSVSVDQACALTLWYHNALTGWVLASAEAAGQTKTFTDAAIDYFELPPQSLFCLVSDTADVVCYHDGGLA